MHLTFDNIADARSNVNYFLFFVSDVKSGLYEINKKSSANATHGRVRSKKCSETEPNRCWTGEVQDQDLDLYRVRLYTVHCTRLY